VDLWDDTKINPGSNWQKEISETLDGAQIAILLVSANFLSSDFILNQELPKILKRSSEDGLIILWVSVGYCMYEETELAVYQSVNNPAKPLESLSSHEQDRILLDICKKIKNTITPQENTQPVFPNTSEIEIHPDDWNSNPNGILGRLKKLF
jgi:hypothetical protein